MNTSWPYWPRAYLRTNIPQTSSLPHRSSLLQEEEEYVYEGTVFSVKSTPPLLPVQYIN